jgi:hypothetical protein
MSELAEAGHGTTIDFELDPTGSPGVFTAVPELGADVSWPEFDVPETNVTAHNDNIDSWIQGVLMRGPFTFGVNYVTGNTVHEALRDAPLNGLKHGFRLRGPNGSAGVDEIIASGFVKTFGPIVHPVREGARTAQVVVRLSGLMIVDGVSYGA